MRAAIVERANVPSLVTRDDQRAQAELAGDEIVGVRNLALMRQIDPGAAEDMRHLGVEDRRDRYRSADGRGLPAPVRPSHRAARIAQRCGPGSRSQRHGHRYPRFVQRSATADCRHQKKSKYSFCSHSVGSSGEDRCIVVASQLLEAPELGALELEIIIDEDVAELRAEQRLAVRAASSASAGCFGSIGAVACVGFGSGGPGIAFVRRCRRARRRSATAI